MHGSRPSTSMVMLWQSARKGVQSKRVKSSQNESRKSPFLPAPRLYGSPVARQGAAPPPRACGATTFPACGPGSRDLPEPCAQHVSETGRIRFRGVRFQTPNSVSFSGLTEFRGANSVSFIQPIICVPKRTHRVFRRTHRVCRRTQ